MSRDIRVSGCNAQWIKHWSAAWLVGALGLLGPLTGMATTSTNQLCLQKGVKPMRFYWSYHPEYWEGLRLRGLLRGNIGVRFVQSPWAREEEKFNRMAAKGTPLYRLIQENGYGLLVDRGAGGTPYRDYAFDRDLLDAYATRLGDKFLGVQLHEWMGNFAADQLRIRKRGLQALPDSKIEGSLCDFAQIDPATGKEYGKGMCPADPDGFVNLAGEYYRRLAKQFGGYVNLVDSGMQSYDQGLRLSARHVMAELGNQTPMSRLQVACVRGMARAAGRPWGVYYECWGGEPFSVTCYNGKSLWQMPERAGIGEGEGLRHGGAGGSARSLQRRLLLFAWLSGAG